jgi:hypothetical protein
VLFSYPKTTQIKENQYMQEIPVYVLPTKAYYRQMSLDYAEGSA